MITNRFVFLVTIVLVFASCNVEPKPINYGIDACHFCKMNIVDKQHGSEIVTKKGKIFKYDAIECMMQDLKSREESDIAFFMVNTYDNPIELSDATQVIFIKSEAIPSPMGAYLTAFTNPEEATKIIDSNGGDIMDWSQLKEKYIKK